MTMRWWIIATTAALLAAPVQAQEGSQSQAPADSETVAEMYSRPSSYFSAGAAVVVSGKPYKGYSEETYVVPLIDFRWDRLFFRGRSLGVGLLDNDQWRLTVIAEWRFDGYDEDDDSTFRGMDDRDMTLEAGASLSYKDGWGVSNLTFLNDILGKHDGQEVRFSYSKPMGEGKFRVTPYAGLSWNSEDLTDYYYGVRPGEAIAGRPAYNAGDSLNYFAGLGATYQWTEQWSLYGNFTVDWLDDEITDSPIVDKHHTFSLMTGVMYKF